MVAFSAGLPAFVLIKALQPGFFAREDTKTPVKVAVLAVFANLAFNAVFIPLFAHVGIALATTCASWMNASILATILIRRGHLEIDRRLLSRAPRILLSALLMACVVYGAIDFLAPLFITDSFQGVAALGGTVIIGLVSYGLLAFITGGASLTDLRLMMKRRANNEPET
jgi:putative peptidoglycan lipid II flippase